MGKPLISVVVPVYNVENYVEQCLNSILSQSYDNLQVVVVDDGATDGSGVLCDEIAAKNNCIEVYHIENRGLSGARNEGMTHVMGEYVCFVDSDDCLGPFHIENLYSALTESNAELAITGYTEFSVGSASLPKTQKYSETKILTNVEALAIAIGTRSGPFLEHAWGKLYAKSLFYMLEYPLGKAYEDRFVCYKVMHNAKGIVYENGNDYLYLVDRADSIVNQRNIKNLHCLEASRLMYQYVQESFPEALDVVERRWFAELIGGYTIAQMINEPEIADKLYKELLETRKAALVSKNLALTTRIGYMVLPIRSLFHAMAIGNMKRIDKKRKREIKKL